MDEQVYVNTDRELWREREGDYYADSIHVTERGGIGINCGGTVYVKPLREWHKLAGGDWTQKPSETTPAPEVARRLIVIRERHYGEFDADVLFLLDLVASTASQLAAAQKSTVSDSERRLLDALKGSKSPCGHWSQYALTEDGGKHIVCLQCQLAAAEQRAEQAEARAKELQQELEADIAGSVSLQESLRVLTAQHETLRERVIDETLTAVRRDIQANLYTNTKSGTRQIMLNVVERVRAALSTTPATGLIEEVADVAEFLALREPPPLATEAETTSAEDAHKAAERLRAVLSGSVVSPEAQVSCEACEAGYRLSDDHVHYDDARGGWTWGVCRKYVEECRRQRAEAQDRRE